MIGRVNIGGGGTGATLTVNAPAGATVTVSKDGKTKTKTAVADGVAVFKGLKSGQWTLTITDGEQTAQKTVTITADYSTAITFFSATIHITYPAGSACTATDGVTTLTAPDTSGSWDCVVPNAGTWTVACTDGTKTTEKVVSILEDGQSVSLELKYNLYLYKYGDKCEEVTGGWTEKKSTAGYITWNSKNVYFNHGGGAGRYASIWTTNKVDVGNYTKMCIRISDMVTYEGLRAGICSSPYTGATGNESDSNFTAYIKVTTSNSDEQLLELDISEFTGSYYVQIVAGITKAYVYEIYLCG